MCSDPTRRGAISIDPTCYNPINRYQTQEAAVLPHAVALHTDVLHTETQHANTLQAETLNLYTKCTIHTETCHAEI